MLPSRDELLKMARFEVGDMVYLHFHTQWRVTGRCWSKREQCIVYTITFERTNYTTRVRQDELRPVG